MGLIKRIENWEFKPHFGSTSVFLDVKVYQKTVIFGVEIQGKKGVLDSMVSVTVYTILLIPDKESTHDRLVIQSILEILQELVGQGIAHKDAQFYLLQAGKLSDLFFVDIDHNANTAKLVNMGDYPEYFEYMTGEKL